MIPIDIQVSRSKVKGQAYFSYVGEGGICVLQTAIFTPYYNHLNSSFPCIKIVFLETYVKRTFLHYEQSQ